MGKSDAQNSQDFQILLVNEIRVLIAQVWSQLSCGKVCNTVF